MRRPLSLQMRIALTIGILLFASATTMMLFVRQTAKVSIEAATHETVSNRQDAFDMALLDVINRVTIIHLNLFDDAQTLVDALEDPLNDKSEKTTALVERVAASGIDPTTFGEVVLYQQGEYYHAGLANAFVSHPDVQTLESIFAGSASTIVYTGVFRDAVGQTYVTLSQKIVTMYPESLPFAVAIYYLNMSLFDSALAALTGETSLQSDYSFLALADGTTIRSLREDITFEPSEIVALPTEGFVVNDQAILIKRPLERVGSTHLSLDFVVVTVLSAEVLFASLSELNTAILVIGSIAIVFIVLFATQFAKGITKPLNKLIDNLRTFARTKAKNKQNTVNAKDEIYELEKTYDEMIRQIVDLIDTNTTEMENKRKLELYALQMQINPHFLYNTLDAIAWMAKIKKEPEIEKLVLALAKFFRISLHKGDKFIKISEEFDLIRNFVEIEMIRFPNMFEVVYSLDPEIENVEALKLILQPIVENAIKHGFVEQNRIGHLWIKAYPEGANDIVFEVIDDGVGFLPTEDLFSEKRLLHGLGGYGLKNVDERIKLEYGREYGIDVSSKVNEGTTVRIKIKKVHQ